MMVYQVVYGPMVFSHVIACDQAYKRDSITPFYIFSSGLVFGWLGQIGQGTNEDIF